MFENGQRTPATPLSDHYAVFYLLGHEEVNAISDSILGDACGGDTMVKSKSIGATLRSLVHRCDDQNASRTLAKIVGRILAGVHPSRRAEAKGQLEVAIVQKLDTMWEEQTKLEAPAPASAAIAFSLLADLNSHGLISHDVLHHQVNKALDYAHTPVFMDTVVHSLMFRSTTGIGAQRLSHESWDEAIAKVKGMDFGDDGGLVRFAELCQRGGVSYYDLRFTEESVNEVREKVAKICGVGHAKVESSQ